MVLIGMLEFWNVGVLECWSFGMLDAPSNTPCRPDRRAMFHYSNTQTLRAKYKPLVFNFLKFKHTL